MDQDSMQVENISVCLLPFGFLLLSVVSWLSVLLEAGIPGLESGGTVLRTQPHRMAPAGVAVSSSVCWGVWGRVGLELGGLWASPLPKSISVVNVVLEERGCHPFRAALAPLIAAC